jgi:hypothetical protein
MIHGDQKERRMLISEQPAEAKRPSGFDHA